MHTYYGDFQIKAYDFSIKLLKNDPYLRILLGGRVYASHPANIKNPSYPCISVVPSFAPHQESHQLSMMGLSLDMWSKSGEEELWQIYSNREMISNRPVGVRPLLLGPTGSMPNGFDLPEVIIQSVVETYHAGGMYDGVTETWHMVSRFELECAAKNIVAT